MNNIKYYKILTPFDKLLEDLQLNGCFVQGDTSYKYVYMRNPKDIFNVITFNPAVFNNMYDFDSDFSEEYEYSITSDADLSHNITSELKKGNYVDMTYQSRNIILGVPYSQDNPSDLIFLTLTQHEFYHISHRNRNLATIHFTSNHEGMGEVNSNIEKSPQSLRKIFEELNVAIKCAPIKQEITDHYVLYKYADDAVEKNNYGF
ncbi:MAG: hypothetical protein IJA72_01260 [Clostridia bacterium]|nr:hypothetical protein [Clostridia bacterium]